MTAMTIEGVQTALRELGWQVKPAITAVIVVLRPDTGLRAPKLELRFEDMRYIAEQVRETVDTFEPDELYAAEVRRRWGRSPAELFSDPRGEDRQDADSIRRQLSLIRDGSQDIRQELRRLCRDIETVVQGPLS